MSFTLTEAILQRIDAYTRAQNMTRSAFLANAALAAMARRG